MSDAKKQQFELQPGLQVSASTELKVSVTIEEMFGIVRISWDIDSRYPLTNAVAQIAQNGGTYVNHVIQSHKGYWDSNFPYGTGYVGKLWGWWDRGMENNYVFLVQTPVTP